MTGYLLDTNVISAFSPGRGGDAIARAVAGWLEEHTDELFLSVITVLEIQSGIQKARRTGARRAEHLSAWLDEVLQFYGGRVLPLDLAAARLAGSMADAVRAKGRDPGLADIMIAAIARVHEHTIVTRNISHFEWLGVAVHNPFTRDPVDAAGY